MASQTKGEQELILSFCGGLENLEPPAPGPSGAGPPGPCIVCAGYVNIQERPRLFASLSETLYPFIEVGFLFFDRCRDDRFVGIKNRNQVLSQGRFAILQPVSHVPRSHSPAHA